MEKPLETQDIAFRGVWRRERDLNPCYPYGGKHDFESCAFDRSAISAKNRKYYTPIFSKRQVILKSTIKNSHFWLFAGESRQIFV